MISKGTVRKVFEKSVSYSVTTAASAAPTSPQIQKYCLWQYLLFENNFMRVVFCWSNFWNSYAELRFPERSFWTPKWKIRPTLYNLYGGLVLRKKLKIILQHPCCFGFRFLSCSFTKNENQFSFSGTAPLLFWGKCFICVPVAFEIILLYNASARGIILSLKF